MAGNCMAVDDDEDVVTGTEGAVGPVPPPFSILKSPDKNMLGDLLRESAFQKLTEPKITKKKL